MTRLGRRPSWPVRVAQWGAWPLVLAPATILLHETGHLLAAILLGIPDPVLHFSHISHGDAAGLPSWHHGLIGLAGPLVTAAFILFAMGWAGWRRPARWTYALGIAAASRFFVGVPYTIASLVAQLRGRRLSPPAFDEYKAGEALGWSGNLVLGAASFLFFAVIVWLILALPKGERSAAWPGLLLGTALGWALWFTLGPLLLP